MPSITEIKLYFRPRNIVAIGMMLNGIFACSCIDSELRYDQLEGVVLTEEGDPIENVLIFMGNDRPFSRFSSHNSSSITSPDGTFLIAEGFPTEWTGGAACGCEEILYPQDYTYAGIHWDFWYTFIHDEYDTLNVLTRRDSINPEYTTAADTLFFGEETFNGAPGETWHLPPVTMKRKQ